MRQERIEKIIERLEQRNDGGASVLFIKTFGEVVRSYRNYKKWVLMMIGKNGQYQQSGEKDIAKKFHEYIDLIEDIEKNGLKEPISEVSDGCGYEIDGYHRMLILRELGCETIPVIDKRTTPS